MIFTSLVFDGDPLDGKKKELGKTAESLTKLFTLALVNVQGLRSHLAALTAHLRLLEKKPDLVCVTETHLDSATNTVTLEGYELAARRDRSGGKEFLYNIDNLFPKETTV